jgi:membrane associated rhomboid family serine protease
MEEQLAPIISRIKPILLRSPVGERVVQFPSTSFIATFAVFFHLLCLGLGSGGVLNVLAASPSATLMNGKIWTLITSALVEENTTKFGLFLASTLYLSYFLEKEWGVMNVVKLLCVSAVTSAMVSSLVFVAVYMTTYNDDIFFSHIYGLGGLLVSLLTAHVKLSLTQSHLSRNFVPPFVIPLLVTLYSLLGLQFPLHDALLVIFSFLSSLVFLRSEDFSYRDFLPNNMAKRTTTSLDVPVTPVSALPTADPTKERFRAKGFQLLDKKLAELEATPEVPLDFSDRADTVENKV